MANSYNSGRILQLIQICAWKNKSGLGYSEFLDLSEKIANHSEQHSLVDGHPTIAQDYLNRLYNDAVKKYASGENLSRESRHINEICHYIGFSTWSKFEEAIGSVQEYVDFTKIDASHFKTIKVKIIVHFASKEMVMSCFKYAGKTVDFELLFDGIESNQIENLVEELESKLKEVPLIIWTINEDWDKKLAANQESPKLKSILESGRVIPIRVGSQSSEQFLPSKFLKEAMGASGEIGLLMALACINVESVETGSGVKKGRKLFGKIEIGTLNNSGTIFTGDIKQENHGGNNAGGNIIQNYYKKDE